MTQRAALQELHSSLRHSCSMDMVDTSALCNSVPWMYRAQLSGLGIIQGIVSATCTLQITSKNLCLSFMFVTTEGPMEKGVQRGVPESRMITNGFSGPSPLPVSASNNLPWTWTFENLVHALYESYKRQQRNISSLSSSSSLILNRFFPHSQV